MRDKLEDAFARLRAAADADEYVPMEDVIEVVLDRLAHAEDVQNGDDAASRVAERVMREVRKDFEGVVASLQEKLNEKTRGLEAENERLRAAAEEVLSWSTGDTSTLLSNPPQNAALYHAHRILRAALEKKS